MHANLPINPFGVTLRFAKPRLPISDRLSIAADVLYVSYGELIGDTRQAFIAHRRFLLMLFFRDHDGYSYPRIGGIIGNRDHSTVIHGVKRARQLIKDDGDMAALYRRLVLTLKGDA
jgi:chromosomal replication initiator protein